MTRMKKPPRTPTISLIVLQTREIGAADFKARCLELMDEVERTGAEIVITKHRRPVARLVPPHKASGRFCGALADAIVELRDITSPIEAVWQADASNLT